MHTFIARLRQTVWPVLQFSAYIVRASLNDRRTFVVTLFTPVMMLMLFWVVGRPAEPGDTDLVGFIFPGIVGLTVMLGGQAVATRMITWREQGVFQRLAATPVPVGHLVVGAGLAQAAVSVAQAAAVILFGALALGLKADSAGAAGAVLILGLGVLAFIALGILIGSLAGKPDAANAAYMFTLMPMWFIGGGFPPSILPPALQAVSPYLPTAMLNALLSPMLASAAMPANAWQPAAGLLAYTIVLSALAAWRFGKE